MTKSCKDIRISIGAWLDGELSRSDSEEVRVHLESCAGCGEERRQLEKLQMSLKAFLAVAPPKISFERFWRGVEARIAEKKPWHVALKERLGSLSAMPSLAWAVPAVIVLLIGVFSLDSFLPLWRGGAQRNNFAAVESIDAYGRNVALLRED